MTENRQDKPHVLVMSHQSLPYNLPLIQNYCSYEIADSTQLHLQLQRADILYIWDYFWDRNTNELEVAWPKHARLRWVHIANVGLDKIDFIPRHNPDLTITNSPGVYEDSIAEYVLAMVYGVRKGLRRLEAQQTRKDWQRFETDRVAGQTALVLGAGPIGRATASLLKAVGLDVKIFGRLTRPDEAFGTIHALGTFTEHLHETDILVLALPLNRDTAGLLSEKEFARMRTDSLLINVGRGGLVEESSLIAALERQLIGAAVLDVFEAEPLDQTSPLWEFENCYVSPHMSGTTRGWQVRLADVFADILMKKLAKEELA